jgi:hypothetical protein
MRGDIVGYAGRESGLTMASCSSAWVGSSPLPREPGEITAQLDRLGNLQNTLNEEIDALCSDLSPILSRSSNQATSAGETNGQDSALAERVFSHNNSILASIERIRAIRSAIRL